MEPDADGSCPACGADALLPAPEWALVLMAAVDRFETMAVRAERDAARMREVLAKEWGYTLIPEDSGVRVQSMSYVKPSEFAAIVEARALSPSGEPTTTPETSE